MSGFVVALYRLFYGGPKVSSRSQSLVLGLREELWGGIPFYWPEYIGLREELWGGIPFYWPEYIGLREELWGGHPFYWPEYIGLREELWGGIPFYWPEYIGLCMVFSHQSKTTTRQMLNLCIPMMPFTPDICLVVLSLSCSGVKTPLR